MAVHHISASINGLLKQKDSLLGRLFGMAGSEARSQLMALKEKGDKYIASENCKNFNPLTGCCCAENDKGDVKIKGTLRTSQRQIQ